MAPYARMLLQYLHACVAARRRVEAFAFGTRLTRITHELAAVTTTWPWSEPPRRYRTSPVERGSGPPWQSSTAGTAAGWVAVRWW